MKTIGLTTILFLIFAAQANLAGCNLLEVHNNSNIGVKAIVIYPGGSAVVYPDPGSQVEIEADGQGDYSVTVVSSEQWNAQAQDDSQTLSRLLNNPSQLNPDTVRAFQQKLNDIRTRIEASKNATNLAGCKGSVRPEKPENIFEELAPISFSVNQVFIATDAGGKFAVQCN